MSATKEQRKRTNVGCASNQRSFSMNNIKLPLLAAALVAVCTGPALAMPFSDLSGQDQSLKQDVRLVCHANGRCYETRRAARYRYYEPNYSYAPRSYGYYD